MLLAKTAEETRGHCSQTDGRGRVMADVFGTQEPSPGPIKYALAATSGRRRTGALTDSQAEGRGFESPFPLQASPRVCVHDHRVPQMANVDFHREIHWISIPWTAKIPSNCGSQRGSFLDGLKHPVLVDGVLWDRLDYVPVLDDISVLKLEDVDDRRSARQFGLAFSHSSGYSIARNGL